MKETTKKDFEKDVTTTEVTPEQFNLPEKAKYNKFKLSNFTPATAVKKQLTIVKVRKPGSQEFVRVKDDPNYSCSTLIIEFKETGEWFLVDPALQDELANESTAYDLLTAITKNGDLFLWPIRTALQDVRKNTWTDSSIEAANLAKKSWVKLKANINEGLYDTYIAGAKLPDPVWPEVEFDTILDLAFKGKTIESIDHPVVKKLRGEL